MLFWHFALRCGFGGARFGVEEGNLFWGVCFGSAKRGLE